MSAKLQPRVSDSTESIRKINGFFDCAELIVERSESLIAKSKPLAITLFLFAHLVIDLIVILAVLLHRSG